MTILIMKKVCDLFYFRSDGERRCYTLLARGKYICVVVFYHYSEFIIIA